MKASRKFLSAVLMSGVFAVASFAVPPSKSMAPRATKPAPTDISKLPAGPCTSMRGLATGGAKGHRTVQCTPELMKKDPRCRALCQTTVGR